MRELSTLSSKKEGDKMTYVLGITGGIASGKSTVSQYFSERNIPIIDADIVAREVVEIGTPGLSAIVASFGQEVLLEDGSLNRKKLGDIIFKDSDKRTLLNALLKEFIDQRIHELICYYRKETTPLVILDIPLLFEAGYEEMVDEVMLVFVSKEQQLDRLMARNDLTVEEAKARINSQMPLQDKTLLSDTIIDNNGTRDNTVKQLDNWMYRFYATR